MIERLLRAAFGRPALVILLALAGCGLGAVWLRELRRDVFPDLSAPVFNVIVQNAAMSAEELETGIDIPMEAALSGLPDLRRIRSVNQLGVSQITLEFEPDADYFRSRQLVAERVAQVVPELPPGTETPLLSSLSARLNEVIELTLSAEPGVADLMSLRDFAEFEVRNRLLAVPGVAGVERLGGYLRQFQVQIDPERMSARGVSLEEILHAVDGASANAAGGFLAAGAMEWTIRALGRAEGVGDLRKTVVAVRGGVPVLLGDVADVLEAPALRRGLAHRLDGEIVSARVIKQFGADTLEVSRGVRAAVEELRGVLPAGVQLAIVYDQAELVEEALGGVTRAILLGAGLVILVLFGLLGDVRAALLVTLALPLSIALAGLFLRLAGIGINTMTLGGLAIAVGLLVDAAIIVTENIVHRLRARPDAAGRRAAALEAAAEVGRPIAFATGIVIAVFAPLFAMQGVEGRMYQPLAGAVVAAVGSGLLLALTLVPVLAGLLLRPGRPGRPEDVWILRQVKRGYAPLLDFCLRRAAWVRGAAAAVTVPALFLASRIGSDLMPQMDEGAFLIQTLLPPETSLEQVDQLNHRVEDILRTIPEVEDVVRRTGRSEQTEDPMPHTLSDVLVVLRKDRQRSFAQLEQVFREALAEVPGVAVVVTTPLQMRIDEGLAGTPADLSIRIFGPDLERLADLAERARAAIAPVPGIEDLRVEALTGLPQIRVAVDRDAVTRVGLTPGDVIRALRIGLAGEKESEIWLGQRRFDLVVRLQESRRGDLAALRALLIDGHDGTRIPLGQLASIEPGFGPGVIRRESGSRRIAVEASVAGRDLAGAAAEVRERLAEAVSLPTGYFMDVGGRVETQARTSRALLLAVGAGLLAVFVLLNLALGSMAEALLILATLPVAFVGGILALILAGETWNISSLVGLIGLLGIAVQNGLVLVVQTRALRAEGQPFAAALREACLGRVRPKLMTAATAILGLLPLLLLRFHGTEIERPLAVVMVGGLLTSTLFTLLVLPAFYLWVDRLRRRLSA